MAARQETPVGTCRAGLAPIPLLSADQSPTDDRTELVARRESAGALGAFSGVALLSLRAKLVLLVQTRVKGDRMQGHIRRRGKASYEYIVDVGVAAAQRCSDCGRRFWIERKPRPACPRCGGALVESEERRRTTKAGFATRKECAQGR